MPTGLFGQQASQVRRTKWSTLRYLIRISAACGPSTRCSIQLGQMLSKHGLYSFCLSIYRRTYPCCGPAEQASRGSIRAKPIAGCDCRNLWKPGASKPAVPNEVKRRRSCDGSGKSELTATESILSLSKRPGHDGRRGQTVR